ncbi:MAG TPA: hypothetical protein VGE97_02775 [Nitrososphaera sp.]|jgi:hypothetical protein
MNVIIVDGLSRTGLYAPDGSFTVVQADGSKPIGVQHPCGALNVTPVTGDTHTGVYAADGSLNVIEAAGQDYYHPCGAIRITIVSGVFI